MKAKVEASGSEEAQPPVAAAPRKGQKGKKGQGKGDAKGTGKGGRGGKGGAKGFYRGKQRRTPKAMRKGRTAMGKPKASKNVKKK